MQAIHVTQEGGKNRRVRCPFWGTRFFSEGVVEGRRCYVLTPVPRYLMFRFDVLKCRSWIPVKMWQECCCFAPEYRLTILASPYSKQNTPLQLCNMSKIKTMLYSLYIIIIARPFSIPPLHHNPSPHQTQPLLVAPRSLIYTLIHTSQIGPSPSLHSDKKCQIFHRVQIVESLHPLSGG